MKTKLRVILIHVMMISLLGCMPQTDDHILNQAKSDFQHHDYSQAFNLLMGLAEKNNAQAQYTIGYMYFYGLGVQKNTEQAKYWIKKAADNGNPNAIRALEIGKKGKMFL